MPAGWAAAAAAVVSAVISYSASEDASSRQAESAANALKAQQAQQASNLAQGLPWRQSGANALDAINNGFGLPLNYMTRNNGSASQNLTADQIRANLLPQFTSATSANNQDMMYAGGTNNFNEATGTYTPASPTVDEAGLQSAVNAQLAAQNSAVPAGGSVGGVGFGQFNHTFNAADLKNGLAPNYDFQLQQGEGALNSQNSVAGGLVGGNALTGLNNYAQNTAAGAYQQAFNNYNTQQTNIYNRLANIAGLGQTQNGQTGNQNTVLAGNAGSAMMAGGAAQAAGIVGGSNAISGGLTNAASMYAYGNNSTPSGVPSGGSSSGYTAAVNGGAGSADGYAGSLGNL